MTLHVTEIYYSTFFLTAKMGKPASEDEWGWPIRTHPHSQAC
jgi:hypothetical protein